MTSWGFPHASLAVSKDSGNKFRMKYMPWLLPPLSNSWIILIIWFYIAPSRTPNIDCYWRGGQYPIYFLIPD